MILAIFSHVKKRHHTCEHNPNENAESHKADCNYEGKKKAWGKKNRKKKIKEKRKKIKGGKRTEQEKKKGKKEKGKEKQKKRGGRGRRGGRKGKRKRTKEIKMKGTGNRRKSKKQIIEPFHSAVNSATPCIGVGTQ